MNRGEGRQVEPGHFREAAARVIHCTDAVECLVGTLVSPHKKQNQPGQDGREPGSPLIPDFS